MSLGFQVLSSFSSNDLDESKVSVSSLMDFQLHIHFYGFCSSRDSCKYVLTQLLFNIGFTFLLYKVDSGLQYYISSYRSERGGHKILQVSFITHLQVSTECPPGLPVGH